MWLALLLVRLECWTASLKEPQGSRRHNNGNALISHNLVYLAYRRHVGTQQKGALFDF